MEKIQSILQTLSKSEVKYLKHLITVFHGKGDNKLLALIQLIEKKPDITQEEAALKLYQDPKSKAFFMTKGRLMDRLYDLLLLTTDLPNANLVEEDPHASHLADLHKKVPLAIALRKRGLSHIAKNIIEEALKDEMLGYYPNLKAYYLELYRSMISSDIQQFYEINKQLNQYMLMARVDSLALGFLHELKLINQISSYNSNSISTFLKEKLEILEEQLNITYSPISYYCYLSLKSTFFELKKKYYEFKQILIECIKFNEEHPLIADNNRKSLPYIKLSYAHLHLKEYQMAVNIANQIESLIIHRQHNWSALLSIKCYSWLYLGELISIDEIEKQYPMIIDKPTNHNERIINYVLSAKYYYENQFKKALLKIGTLDIFFDNKYEYNSRLRIFEILVYLETQKIDLAVAKLEALRKHLSKYEAPPRVQATYKILHYLELQSFDFGRKNEEIEAMLIDLEANSPWLSFSLEAVRFDTWVRAQYAKRSYWEQWKVENPHIFG